MSSFLDNLSIRFLLKLVSVLIVLSQLMNNIFVYFVFVIANSQIFHIKEQAEKIYPTKGRGKMLKKKEGMP